MNPRAFFAIPGDIETLTGGYGYDRRVLALSPGIVHLPLPGDFPLAAPGDMEAALKLMRDAPAGATLLVDGLAFGALPARGLAAINHPLVALVHHPLGLETGLDMATSRRLIANEREALGHADAVIVTSATTGETLVADFGVSEEDITVAEPGVDPVARARGSGGAVISLLSVGSIVPRKGFDVLVNALHAIEDLPWRLTIVGSTDRAPECAAALRAQIARLGLGERVELLGEMGPDALSACYDRADVFVLSSHYEGYGMVLAEAMAHGLPIAMTRGGAAARTVPDDAALKVQPGDAAALATAIRRLIEEAPKRCKIAENAWRAGQSATRWETTAAIIARVIDRVSEPRR